MDWPKFAYEYDGSFAGFLTCVFTAYANKEEPACFLTGGDGRVTLWPQRAVDTDQQKARRVYRSLTPRLGRQGKTLGVVLKRAQYFITCSGRMLEGLRVSPDGVLRHLVALEKPALAGKEPEQLSLF